uniref:MAGUK p55 subfamily member 7 n=1 Tax=Strigamia maritima TaxID=126957 RepID=T1JH09_STRMM
MPNGSGEPTVQRLLATLDQVRYKVNGSEDDYQFLRDLLANSKFRALLLVHDRINQNGKEPKQPATTNAFHINEEVLDLAHKSKLREFKELFQILSSSHMKSLLLAHDQIASKDYYPKLPEIPREVDEDEETVKIVQLVKSNEPLGATIKHDDNSGTVVIARIMHGGAADRSGLIHEGDEVHEVNGINVRGKTPNDVLHILDESIDGTITFKLIPAEERAHSRESKVRVRAAFDFDPRKDLDIPCREAGLPFHKGEVMHIVNQDDPNWWQARKEGDRNVRAGLIPGRLLQERRILNARNELNDDDEVPLCSFTALSSGRSPLMTPRRTKGTKKIMYDAMEKEDFDREEIATYEEVARYYPRPGIYRPIILIGPPGVGRNELKRRLLAIEPDHFKTTIPHTSRPAKPSEVDGKEYYFVSREVLEEEIRKGRFVEHGEYKGNLYGTSLETVKSIVNAGYVCVMNPHPQALKLLRTAELKPLIIFIKPPPFEQLKETRHNFHARSTFDESCSRGFSDEEFHDITNSANRIDYLYGHLFDFEIINEDLMTAFDELYCTMHQIEMEPQWVPASWVQ